MNSAVTTLISSNAADGVAVLGIMQNVMAGANEPGSALSQMKDKIDSVNGAETLTDPSRSSYRADEIANIMAGNSAGETNDTSFSAKLEQARGVGSKINNLFVQRRNAFRKSLITSGAADSEFDKIGEMITEMGKSTSGDSDILDVSDIVSQSLGMANATSGDATIGNLLRAKLVH